LSTTGTPTLNYVTKFTATTPVTIGNSLIYDNGTSVGINTASPSNVLSVNGNADFGATSTAFAGPATNGAITFPHGQLEFLNTSNVHNDLYLTSNAALNASGTFNYMNTATAASIGFWNGNIYFATAPSGTAGTAVAWNANPMTIMNTGYIGIGKTPGSFLLDVNGQVNATGYCINGANCINTWPSGGGGMSGSGTTNYIPVFNGATSLTNSIIQQSGSSIGIGKTPSYNLDVAGTVYASSYIYAAGTVYSNGTAVCQSNGTNCPASSSQWTTQSGYGLYYTGGSVGIGVTSPGYTLQVGGTVYASSYIYAAGQVYSNGYAVCQSNGVNCPSSSSQWTTQSGYGIAYTGGYVGVNYNYPSWPLEVGGVIYATGAIYASNGYQVCQSNGVGCPSSSGSQWTTNGYGINYSSGNVGIGTVPSSGYTLQVSGTIYASNYIYSSSAVYGYPVYSNGYAVCQSNGSNCPSSGGSQWSTNGSYIYYNGGNVGIGTAYPGGMLDVETSNSSVDAIFAYNFGTGGTAIFAQATHGGYGLWTPDSVNVGTTLYYGSAQQNSDRRLKKNINTLDDNYGLNIIDKLNPVSFNWKDETKGTALQYGFIAQDMQTVLPDLVSIKPGKDDMLSLNYIGLIAPMVKSIQEQQKEINDQNQKIDDLIKEVGDLNKQVEELKTK
jgi:Chaperone of endosialidase